jgi:predicted metal-dependent phosphoesterase TrpH
MIIDFHDHVKVTKSAPFSLEYFLEIIQEARSERLTAFTLTEHFQTDRFLDIYDMLDAQYPYVHEYYDVDGLKIFAGMEIDIQEGGHVLFIGQRQAVRELRQQLDNYVNPDNYIPIAELFKRSAAYNFLKIGAHPFRPSHPLHHLSDDILMHFDAFDLNGSDLYTKGIDQTKAEVYEFAARLGKPVVAGSDAHHSLQYGCVYNTLDQECNTIDELRQTIQSGAYQSHISPHMTIKVKAAKQIKALLKAHLQSITA